MSWFQGVLLTMLGLGLFFNIVGILGLLRFPDIYSRLHAETKTTTLGTILTSFSVAGYSLHQYFSGQDAGSLGFVVRIVIVLFLLAFTNATGSHAIAQSAYSRGQKPAGAVVDALAERQNQSPGDGV